jgi:hypothetical protein
LNSDSEHGLSLLTEGLRDSRTLIVSAVLAGWRRVVVPFAVEDIRTHQRRYHHESVYQVCWQRLLFASFGVNVESITVIVSVFMRSRASALSAAGN